MSCKNEMFKDILYDTLFSTTHSPPAPPSKKRRKREEISQEFKTESLG
jgi:hypothetical protein